MPTRLWPWISDMAILRIKWEQKKETNLGFELGCTKAASNTEFRYFNEKVSDLLIKTNSAIRWPFLCHRECGRSHQQRL